MKNLFFLLSFLLSSCGGSSSGGGGGASSTNADLYVEGNACDGTENASNSVWLGLCYAYTGTTFANDWSSVEQTCDVRGSDFVSTGCPSEDAAFGCILNEGEGTEQYIVFYDNYTPVTGTIEDAARLNCALGQLLDANGDPI